MRLYGVQACIRGTAYTDTSGQKQDCGAVSLAMLAAIVKDTKPSCAPVAQLTAPGAGKPSTILVICSAHVGDNALDLGTLLITQGFAFAAMANTGKPVYLPYSLEESIAQQSRVGLWAYPDMPHPNRVLFAHTAKRE
ncbi:thermonuclease family protein [Rhizobium rhizogenes]|uniref:thermonuclease family protein n=1 Tax=Rhizobium rhizogenes TaxID=359 RepID=UPI001F23491B|nr:thermonuclease family protein [Rhizobium rhizogenes]